MEKIKNDIISFGKLKDNWDGYKAKAITQPVIDNALNLLRLCTREPFVAPTACNTIQFEYEIGDKYFEIECTDYGYEIYRNLSGKEYERSFEKEQLYKVVNEMKIFFNGYPIKPVLFTGAFNPPTIAHKHMINSAIENGGFDYVIFAISNQRFLNKKQARLKDTAYSEVDRLNMILEMTAKDERVIVFGVEEGYTYNVLCKVKETYNIDKLYFALGSDKLQEVERWGHSNDLLTQFCFYVLQRNHSDDYVNTECERIFARTEYIIGSDNEEFKDISATQVRKQIKEGTDYRNLVPIEVYNYLEKIKE